MVLTAAPADKCPAAPYEVAMLMPDQIRNRDTAEATREYGVRPTCSEPGHGLASKTKEQHQLQRIAPPGSRPAFEPEIFRSRYLQLTRFDHLTDDRIEALGRVLANRPELEAAWRMLQHLYGIHLAADSDEANQALGAFIDTYADHPLVEFEKLTETLLEWGDEIFAFHDADRASNGRIEGTNNKLSVLERVSVNRPSMSAAGGSGEAIPGWRGLCCHSRSSGKTASVILDTSSAETSTS